MAAAIVNSRLEVVTAWVGILEQVGHTVEVTEVGITEVGTTEVEIEVVVTLVDLLEVDITAKEGSIDFQNQPDELSFEAFKVEVSKQQVS